MMSTIRVAENDDSEACDSKLAILGYLGGKNGVSKEKSTIKK